MRQQDVVESRCGESHSQQDRAEPGVGIDGVAMARGG
jgi:hypothetical protein